MTNQVKPKNTKKNRNKKKNKTAQLSPDFSSTDTSPNRHCYEEMSCFYVDPITGEIKIVPIEQDVNVFLSNQI